MIKHKREVFLSASEHRALVISGVFFGCAALDSLRMCFAIQEAEGRGFFIPAILFAVVSVFLLSRGLFKALARRKNAIKSRHDFMQNGILSHGKVTAAGGGYYQQGHYREMHVRKGKSKHFRVWESCWWADIEYYDKGKGTYQRRRVLDLNKNGTARLIGKDVAIYRLDKAVYVDFK